MVNKRFGRCQKNYLERIQKGTFDMNALAAIDLDSTFYLARIHFLNANRGGLMGDNKIHY